jgi:Protein kinase domain
MGEVYRAKDTKLGRDVALKILPATFTNDPERVARFRREAQVLASLNHPHIAQIHGMEEANGTQFLVLELVDGEAWTNGSHADASLGFERPDRQHAADLNLRAARHELFMSASTAIGFTAWVEWSARMAGCRSDREGHLRPVRTRPRSHQSTRSR